MPACSPMRPVRACADASALAQVWPRPPGISSHAAPPYSMVSVLGDYKFTDPVALGLWNPPDAGGIYAISCATADPGVHCLVYIGMTSSFSERGIASHKKRWCWNGAGEYIQNNMAAPASLDPRPAAGLCITQAPDGVPLYVSVLFVDGKEKRSAIEMDLLAKLGPPCNGEFSCLRDSNCYVPARSQAYRPQFVFFVPGSP